MSDAKASSVRKVVIPVAVVALALGVWLITKEPERDPTQVPSTPAPVVPAPENGSTAVGDDARAIAVRGFGLDVWRMENLGNQSGATTTVAYLARRQPTP